MAELLNVKLTDKYELEQGRVFMTGIQALVRLPMLQHRIDKALGLDTAGFITGYRGSPLGIYDQQLQAVRGLLDQHQVIHQPGVNEDIAITACSGTQQVGLDGEASHDGVFAIWYAKGPGVDRSGDALRHANLFGTAKHGGILCLLGDDHTCESSTTAHQSEFAMVDAMIPVLNPAGVDEILDYGLIGIAMSRYSGGLVSLKCVHETVESTASIEISDPTIAIPDDHDLPADGLNIRWPDHGIAQPSALAQERRIHEGKLEAAQAFARANKLDQILLDCREPQLVLITSGKSYLDVVAALEDLEIDAERAEALGLRLYKVGMTYPLEPQGLERAVRDADQVMIIEEKRGLIEAQAKEHLYNTQHRPVIIGKADEFGQPLFQSYGDLNANQVALAIGARLLGDDDPRVVAVRARINRDPVQPAMIRTPYFCAGCPHNSSTKLPDGSKALAGIGCHFLVQLMGDETRRFTQMGGEGASWLGEGPFSKRPHIFQNIGDGTYYHSGSMAIRAAVASDVNITFKILYNDAVAMTGGQKMEVGNLTVPQIARDVAAEGVVETVIVTDEPDKYPLSAGFPHDVRIFHRDELDAVQRRLRGIEGVTVLIYDQTCAAEKRRRRKRGGFPDPDRRVVINQQVCEGCGDCGAQSNCVAIHPVETEFGRKRTIDQSSCNKDFSCVKGFCPSFVTVHGGRVRRGSKTLADAPFEALPDPEPVTLQRNFNIVVTGIGGTGVVTIAALLGMAAHLEAREFAAIDMIGLAQKGGSVISHLKIAPQGFKIGAPRVAAGQADLVLGCDLVVAGGKACLPVMQEGRTNAIINLEETMTGAFTKNPDLAFPARRLLRSIEDAVGAGQMATIDASSLAKQILGDAIGANLMVVGFAYQRGLLPVTSHAIERAIELNGVAVALNKQAFVWGRRLAHDGAAVARLLDRPSGSVAELSLEALIEHRARFLADYQDQAYAARYQRRVDQIKAFGSDRLTRAVAHNLFKLMAIKDEFEVARLFADGTFKRQLEAEFEHYDRLEFHLAPPLLAARDLRSGHQIKSSFGPWMMRAFAVLAKLRRYRGRWFDPFSKTDERRLERAVLHDYEALLDELVRTLTPEREALAIGLVSLPGQMRGFGHVKAANIERAKAEEATLLKTYRGLSSTAEAAE